MKHHRLGFMLILLIALALIAPAAMAQNSRVTIDDNGLGIDKARVTTAAGQLTSAGARVVVVTTNAVGSGTALNYLDQKLSALNIARSSNSSDLPADVVIFYISSDPNARQSSIFYGRNFSSALTGEASRIREDRINPRLRSNDFTGGIVEGINGVASVIADPVGARTEERDASSGSFGSGLVTILGIIAVGAVALFVVPAFLKSRSKQKETMAGVVSTQSRFAAAKQAAGVAIADLGRQMSDAREKQRFDKVSYPKTQAQELEQRHQAAESRFHQLQVQFDDLGERIDAIAQPTAIDLEGAAGGYDGVRAQAQEVSRLLADMDALRKQLDSINAQAPAEVDRAKKF